MKITHEGMVQQTSIEEQVMEWVRIYYMNYHQPKPFIAGSSPIPVSGKVFDEREMQSLTKAMLDFWLTEGDMADTFKRNLQAISMRRYAILCNSGSSANLLAISSMARPGMRVVTPAVGFPTTLNPIIQNKMVPVFVDSCLGTYVPDAGSVMGAIQEFDADMVVLPHTLGNIAPLLTSNTDVLRVFDACDALGSTYDGHPVTSYGDVTTLSFYPAHQITTGEGGCVLTDSPRLKLKIDSLCGWGRDCWCDTGCDNTCNKRFDWKFPDLPKGYDHKYVYSEIGYNLKMTDLQAAVGIPQLGKLPFFIEARKDNFNFYYVEFASRWQDHFILPVKSSQFADPAWFGFPLTIRLESPIKRLDLLKFLDSKKIGTRLIFGGNLLRQPAYKGIQHEFYEPLINSNIITENSFWIGVYPGITPPMREYVIECFDEFMKGI